MYYLCGKQIDMLEIKQFETNAGVLFSFEERSGLAVYLSSDINAVSEDILSQPKLEGEFYVGAMFKWQEKYYHVTHMGGHRNYSLVSGVEDQYHGKVNKHSVMLRFFVIEVTAQKYKEWLNER
jgi:hypothetical protein